MEAILKTATRNIGVTVVVALLVVLGVAYASILGMPTADPGEPDADPLRGHGWRSLIPLHIYDCILI